MNLPLALLEGVDPWIFVFSFVTVAVTLWMGFRSAKTSKTASDFFVAGRSVSVGWNTPPSRAKTGFVASDPGDSHG